MGVGEGAVLGALLWVQGLGEGQGQGSVEHYSDEMREGLW